MKRTPLKRTFWVRKKRKPLNYVSTKRRRRAAKVSGIRRKWVNEAEFCMACGHSSKNPNPRFPIQLSKVDCHEISNGPDRDKSLDKPFACLCLCRYCNGHEFTNKAKWPETRQLCLLMVRAFERYNLEAYLKHTRPRAMQRITQAEVEAYLPSIPIGWPWG